MAVVVGGTPQSVYIKGQDDPLEVNFPAGVMTLPVEVTSPVTISMLNFVYHNFNPTNATSCFSKSQQCYQLRL